MNNYVEHLKDDKVKKNQNFLRVEIIIEIQAVRGIVSSFEALGSMAQDNILPELKQMHLSS